jgi:hypothetical protein
VRRLALLVIFVAGCGGADDGSPRAERIARTWVEAVNGQDYERACDLSYWFPKKDCLTILENAEFGTNLDATEINEGGSSRFGPAEATFVLSRNGAKPLTGLHVAEDRDGELRVSWWDTIDAGPSRPLVK